VLRAVSRSDLRPAAPLAPRVFSCISRRAGSPMHGPGGRGRTGP
jgi:hypothetical protein